MSSDYYIGLKCQMASVAFQYENDIKCLEKEKRDTKDKRARQGLIEKIKLRKQRLFEDIKGDLTISSERLVSEVLDLATIWCLADLPRKQDVQEVYMQIAAALEKKDFMLPETIEKPHWPETWPSDWLGIDVSFSLVSPWYSKDDRTFHLLDNSVRKDLIFGVPYLSASSWKGLLRWAYGMETGIIGPELESEPDKIDQAKRKIIHLFGNEKGEQEHFRAGALAFYPTWFDKIGFEVINPHNRETRAGRQPIYYEVVPPETEGSLRLLYAPLPGQAKRDQVNPLNTLLKLIESANELLTKYGVSAKRTAGWGAAKIKENGWILYGTREPATKKTPEPPRSKRKMNSFRELGALKAELDTGPGKSKKEIIKMLEKHLGDDGVKR